MEIKKKFLGIKMVVLLLFVLSSLFAFSTTCFAGYNDTFSQAEIDQVNTFFNVNYSLENYNTALNGLKNIYPTLNKLNIFFIKNSTDDNLYIYPNNGTFDNNLEYIYIRGNLYSFYSRWIESIDDSTTSNPYHYVFQKNGNNVNVVGGNSAPYLNYYYDDNHPVINGYILSCPMFLTTISTQSFYYYNPSTQTNGSYFSANYIYLDSDPEPEPEQPSGDNGSGDSPSASGGLGDITTPSGDNGGSINLQPIEQGITNLTNQISGDTEKIITSISGETEKIVNSVNEITDTLTIDVDTSQRTVTSGDITNALGFELATNPYSNFWFELIDGLRSSLTGVVRTLTINFRGSTYTINLDDFALQIPSSLKQFLSIISSFLMFWLMMKWWKIIIDKLTSGNMDEVLQMNEEEGIVDLF